MKRQRQRIPTWFAAVLATLAWAGAAKAERIKDIVQIKGARGNSLIGYGLVIGLNGTGDNSLQTRQAYANYLRVHEGITVEPDDISGKNIASVIVTAELPPFGRVDTSIDVTVSAVAASSLSGGFLLRTELKGADRQVYALAGGNIAIGGYTAKGAMASVTKAHPTVGQIPNGGKIEREVLADVVENGKITLQLINPDYTTAVNIAGGINGVAPDSAAALDKGAVEVTVPAELPPGALAGFIDKVLAPQIEVDSEAVVVINERTGTVVVGQNVAISTVSLAHGSLTIINKERELVSQPEPFSTGGETTTVRESSVDIFEGPGKLHVLAKPEPLTVYMLARTLNAMGVTPTDLVAIFQNLKAQGALQAKLVVR